MMNNEENRLRTFSNWPSIAPVSAERVAKAGFYYTGVGLEVQCFLCGTRITEWNYGDQVIVRHRNAAPDCPFVLDPSSTCNVPLVPASNDSRELLPLNARPRSHCKTNQLISSRREEIDRNYRTINQRLDTFVNWPIPDIVSPQKLAKAGFFYLQQGDMVVCVFCRGIVYQWEPGNDPNREHRIHFPTCDFYLRSDNDIVQLTNVNLISGSTTDYQDLGIQTHTSPQTQSKSLYEARLRTYVDWPTSHSQTPEILADAGFYYIGFQDHVRCYYCDGGLHHWENTDDPWVEHAKWFPRCGFVNLIKGQEFINQCVASRPSADRMIEGSSNHNQSSINENETEENTVTITEGIEDDIVNITEKTEEIKIETSKTNPPSTSEEPSASESFSETELPSATETPSVTETTSVTETPSVTETTSVTETPFVTETTSATEPNFENINHEFSEGLVGRTIPDQAAVEIGLPREAIRIAMERRMERTGNSFSWTTELMQDLIKCIEEDSNRISETEEDPNSPQATKTSSASNDKPVEKESNTDFKSSSISLEEENRKLKEARVCKVCMDHEIAVVFLPCGHLATCAHCALSLTCCPICRKEIRATVRTFLS